MNVARRRKEDPNWTTLVQAFLATTVAWIFQSRKYSHYGTTDPDERDPARPIFPVALAPIRRVFRLRACTRARHNIIQ